MVVAERITPSFSRGLVEPTPREDRLNTHHSRARASVLDWSGAIETGVSPMIHITPAADIVGRYTIMRKVHYCFRPAARPQLTGIITQRLTDTFDVVDEPPIKLAKAVGTAFDLYGLYDRLGDLLAPYFWLGSYSHAGDLGHDLVHYPNRAPRYRGYSCKNRRTSADPRRGTNGADAT
jgi:hypothetical protein